MPSVSESELLQRRAKVKELLAQKDAVEAQIKELIKVKKFVHVGDPSV